MLIIPAIDLKDGRCVRLRQGLADAVTVYGDDPPAMAEQWEQQGAGYLHVVDLDGAFEGHPVHVDVIRRIVEAVKMPVEVGGGLRTDEDIESLLKAGAARAIVGTRAFTEPETLPRLVKRFGERVVVGIDARDGKVQVRGWVETTPVEAIELGRRADAAGIKTIIYTDTSRDGMLDGVNAEAMAEMCQAVGCDVIASGGVSTVEDIHRLAALDCENLCGVIVGKALYDGRVGFDELVAVAGEG